MALAVLVMMLSLVGCTPSGPLGPAPVVEADKAAHVVFIRPSRGQGWARTIPVTIDGVEVYGLKNDQYVALKIPAGERIVGYVADDLVETIRPTVTFHAEPGQIYYVEIVLTPGAPQLFRLSERQAQPLMQEIDDPIKTYMDCKKLGPNPTPRQRNLCR